MDGRAQCPVCTLYLREGITLDAHLDTHPKDQVIKALCALSARPAPAPAPASTSSSPFDPTSGCSSESFAGAAMGAGAGAGAGMGIGRRFRQDFAAALPMSFVVPAPRMIEASPVEAAPGSAFRSVMLLKPYPAAARIISRRPYVGEPPPDPRPELCGAGGLKILSNIKLESPTSSVGFPTGRFGIGAPVSVDAEGDEAILPDLDGAPAEPRPEPERFRPVADDENASHAEEPYPDPGASDAPSNALSVIRNVGNPSAFKETAGSPEPTEAVSLASRDRRRDRAPVAIAPSNVFVRKQKKILAIKNGRIGRKNAASASSALDGAQKRPYDPAVDPAFAPYDGGFRKKSEPRKAEVEATEESSPAGMKAELFDSPCDVSVVIDNIISYADRKLETPAEYCRSEGIRDVNAEGDADNRTSDAESVRPVNVIAYGSMILNDSSDNAEALSDSAETSTELDETIDVKGTDDRLFVNGDSSSANFTSEKQSADNSAFQENISNDDLQKIEVDFDKKCKDPQYLWNQSTEKEEFTFTNFIQCSYAQSLYQKVDCADDKDQLNPLNGKDYTELICPRENFTETDRKGSFLDALGSNKILNDEDALNIRTDERMPPRGELSEQESSGDMDAPWAGMYRDIGGSTSYDLIARESWMSDGSDVDMPASPPKQTSNENEGEDMPIVVSVKPPDKNYKCASCGKAFNCPKERRVHRTKEHSAAINSAITDDKKAGKRVLIKTTSVRIKKEKVVKVETNIPMMPPQMNVMEVHNVNMGFDMSSMNIELHKTEVNNIPELLDTKLKLEFVKDILKRQRRDHSCATCKMEFISESQYHEHLKIHPLECLTCGKLFNRRANLQLHIKRHLGIKNFKCDICDKRFITKQKMVEHYNIHTGRSPVKCNLCDMSFRRHSNMVQHRNHFHFQIKRRMRDYVCACGEVFHSKKKLAWHKEIHDDKPKACLHCNEKFIHTASLTRHMRRAHNNYFVPDDKRKGENVQCTQCNNVYLKSSIEMHMKTHTGSKPYSCVICNKNFTTKWNLKLHTWTHANRSSKPFKCALCKGAFIRQTDYISHMNAHKSVRPYTCNHCGCQFIRKYNCQRHVKEHENEKKYVCEVPDCGKAFHRSYYLTEHLKVHSGVRPFSCNICGKTSSTKSNHNKHLKIHHAREPITTEG